MENKIIVRKYEKKDLPAMIRVWNEVVEDGVAFPQEECLDEKTGAEFFAAQTYTAVAENRENGQVLGLYILHPNNVAAADTSATPATPYPAVAADFILEKSW